MMNKKQYAEIEFKSDIFKLWKVHAAKVGRRIDIPLWYDEMTTAPILVLGCNPSKPKQTKKQKQSGTVTIRAYEDDYKYFHKKKTGWEKRVMANQDAHAGMKTIEGIENDTGHPYFQCIRSMVEHFKVDWSWQDLFAYRITNQSELKSKIKKLPLFFDAQQELSLRLLASRNPKLILCANAFVRERLQHLVSPIRNTSCYYELLVLSTYDGRKIPIIFSCPFGGQRAIDRGLRDLYQWNLKRVLRNLEIKH